MCCAHAKWLDRWDACVSLSVSTTRPCWKCSQRFQSPAYFYRHFQRGLYTLLTGFSNILRSSIVAAQIGGLHNTSYTLEHPWGLCMGELAQGGSQIQRPVFAVCVCRPEEIRVMWISDQWWQIVDPASSWLQIRSGPAWCADPHATRWKYCSEEQ